MDIQSVQKAILILNSIFSRLFEIFIDWCLSYFKLNYFCSYQTGSSSCSYNAIIKANSLWWQKQKKKSTFKNTLFVSSTAELSKRWFIIKRSIKYKLSNTKKINEDRFLNILIQAKHYQYDVKIIDRPFKINKRRINLSNMVYFYCVTRKKILF